MTDLVQIRALIDAIAIKEGGLHAAITHSFGAVPTTFAMREGLDLDRLVLISPPSEFAAMLRIFQNELAIPDSVMAAMRDRIETNFPQLGQRIWHDLSTHISARHFQMPGMVIHDRADKVVPISQARMIADSWRDVQRYETNGLGHRRILKDPAVVERVATFIDPPSAEPSCPDLS